MGGGSMMDFPSEMIGWRSIGRRENQRDSLIFEAGTVGRRRGVRPRISIEPSVPIKTLSGETARLENTQNPT